MALVGIARNCKKYYRTSLLFMAILLISFTTNAQNKFVINGKLKVEGGDLREAAIAIERNGHKVKTISAGNGTFSIPLDFNCQYILSFEKDGFVTKKLSFDTHAPGIGIEDGFHPFDFTVSLFKQYDEVNIVVFNQPVGIIKYYEEIDDFDYDTDYTKSIQSRLRKVLEEVKNAKKDVEKNERRVEKEAKKVDDEKTKSELNAAKASEAEQKAQKKEEQNRALVKVKEKNRKRQDAKTANNEQHKAEVFEQEEKRKRAEAMARLAQLKEKIAIPHDGVDSRMESITHEEFDQSPIRAAQTILHEVDPIIETIADLDLVRNEELIIEDTKIITRITLDNGYLSNEYKKVVHKFGATFYFKNGQSCSQQTYEFEALADN